MSAKDIAYAVVFTPISAWLWWGLFTSPDTGKPEYAGAVVFLFVTAIATSWQAVYRIARLCGASS